MSIDSIRAFNVQIDIILTLRDIKHRISFAVGSCVGHALKCNVKDTVTIAQLDTAIGASISLYKVILLIDNKFCHAVSDGKFSSFSFDGAVDTNHNFGGSGSERRYRQQTDDHNNSQRQR